MELFPKGSQRAKYVLPQLPPKAKPRLDHHGFREPGTKAVEDRVKHLSSAIRALLDIEERYEAETEELSSSASQVLKIATARKKSVTEDPSNLALDKKLRSRVVMLFGETEDALQCILKQLEGTRRSLQENAFQTDPTIMKEKGKWAKYTWWTADWNKKKREAEARKKKAESDCTKLIASISERTREPDTIHDLSDTEKIQDSTGTTEKELKYNKSEYGSQRLDIRTEESEREAIQIRDGDPGSHETSSSGSGPGSDYDKEYENEGEATRQALLFLKKQEIQKCEVEIGRLDDKINRYTERLQNLHKDGKKTEEMQFEDNLEKEEEHHQKMKKMLDHQFEDFKSQERRDTALRELESEVLAIRADGSDASRSWHSKRGSHSLMRMEMMREMQRLLKMSIGPYHEYLAPSRFPRRFDDSDSESTDDNESRPDKMARQKFLGLLEKLVSDAQMLEAHIFRIQSHIFTLDHTVHLRETLELEQRLEHEWLHKVGEQGSSSTEQSSHFLSSRVPERIYQPLGANEFRVLALIPAPESYYPMICTLEVWSLDDVSSAAKEARRKTYAALSYFWGSEDCNGRIYLLSSNDIPSSSDAEAWGLAIAKADRIHVRNNLFRALLRLRRCGPGAETVALWVDYMCINQVNAEEKTKQLSKMVNIYGNASNVCIWLGESDNRGRSGEAMEFITTIMDFAVLDRYAQDKKQARKWHALGELMRDRWFSRRWVVQEVALSKDATVHCGGSMVRWSDFADAASLLASNQETIKSLFDVSEWREGRSTLGDVDSFGASILLEATNKLFRRKAGGQIKRPIKSIESLVTSLKTFDTGDPRDLIYSVVSIASDTSGRLWDPDNEQETGPRLKVDYKKPQVDVYKEFTKFCVLSSKAYALDIICRPWAMPLKSGAGEKVDVPSWIPLLSNSEYGIPEEVYKGRRNGEVLVGPAGYPNYKACGPAVCEVRFGQWGDRISVSDLEQSELPESHRIVEKVEVDDTSYEKNTLFAKGFRLGEIQQVSERNTGGVILHDSLKMGGWKEFGENTDSVPDRLWRTLVADRDQDGQVPPSWYQRACLRCLEVADTFNNGDLNVGELLQGHSDMLRKYLVRVRNVTWNRRFFKATVDGSVENVQDSIEKTVEGDKDQTGNIPSPPTILAPPPSQTTKSTYNLHILNILTYTLLTNY